MAVHVDVGDEWVVVRFTGLERLLTMTHGAQLPIRAITSAQVQLLTEVDPELSWSPFATRVPGVAVAGSFAWDGHPGGRQLWCVERDAEVLVVDLDAEACELPYGRVVLQHPDRNDLAWWIAERVSG
jgi:hypothetical protein